MLKSLTGISVVMSVYNEPLEWLQLSVESILKQDYENFEFIIINDNPASEELKSVLQVYAVDDSRVKIVNNAENIGLTRSLNIGLSLSQGKYIARMDADDIAMPSRLTKQFGFMERNPKCVASGTFYYLMTEQLRLFTLPVDNLAIRSFLLIDNAIAHPTAIIRRETLLQNNVTYNESYKYSQDYDLWCQLAKFGELKNLSEPLLKYRVSANQISTSKKPIQKQIALNIRLAYLEEVCNSIGISSLAPNFLHLVAKNKQLSKDLKRAYYNNLQSKFLSKIFAIIKNLDFHIFSVEYVKLLKRNSI